MPDRAGTAVLRYANKRANLPMAPELLERVETAVALLGTLGHGQATVLHTMGTYNSTSRLPNGQLSQHAINPPRAIDVSGVEWQDGAQVWTLDRHRMPDLYWRVEASLREGGFGIVLGWDYGEDHHNHWHCDFSKAWGTAGRSQTLFVNAALAMLGYANVLDAQEALGQRVDQVVGPQTLKALCRAVRAHGLQVEQPRSVVRIGTIAIPYRMEGDTAVASVRAMAEALDATVDTSGWPVIVVTPKGD